MANSLIERWQEELGATKDVNTDTAINMGFLGFLLVVY
jgi:hypothetical protein